MPVADNSSIPAVTSGSSTTCSALPVIKMLDQQTAVVLHDMKRQAAIERLDRLLAFFSDLDLKISPTIGRAIAQFPINISEDHLAQVRGIEKPFVVLAQAFLGRPVIGSDILIEQAEKLVDIARFINKNEFLQ